jgi:hypothetical protein
MVSAVQEEGDSATVTVVDRRGRDKTFRCSDVVAAKDL